MVQLKGFVIIFWSLFLICCLFACVGNLQLLLFINVSIVLLMIQNIWVILIVLSIQKDRNTVPIVPWWLLAEIVLMNIPNIIFAIQFNRSIILAFMFSILGYLPGYLSVTMFDFH
jgi:hypothetical protein